ncbi:translation initiation factor 2 [Streptomyces bambusae]|uniref:Translation initiation factor 2 n=1 Tax=Streptomyces bambusae TaxID=1550616 RepID=A0ABS6ZFJ7_9ACTN|nr:translation initiation factor 2 [Streptomyces bambusae]MBW5486537.1 translation initiation factor 2 [Streptomyces bambusae]
MAHRDRFSIVGKVTDCHLYEGDGTRPILEENIRVLYQNRRVQFPDELGLWRREIEDEEARKQAAGEPYRWNNPRFAVESLVVSRTHTAEWPQVTLSLLDADYYDFLTTSLNLGRTLKNGSTLRKQYLEDADPMDAPPWMFCSLGVNVAVETGKDGKMLFSHRSAKVAGPNASRWNSSANEGLAANHDLSPTGEVNLHRVARRALREELAVQDADRVDLELLGFGLDLRNNQWSVFFRAVLEDLGEEELRSRWGRGIEDKWEHDQYAFTPNDPESVLTFLHQTPLWAPCAPALFYLALVRGAVRAAGGATSARLTVEEAERRVLDHARG